MLNAPAAFTILALRVLPQVISFGFHVPFKSAESPLEGQKRLIYSTLQ